jgi:hypothetical protein
LIEDVAQVRMMAAEVKHDLAAVLKKPEIAYFW